MKYMCVLSVALFWVGCVSSGPQSYIAEDLLMPPPMTPGPPIQVQANNDYVGVGFDLLGIRGYQPRAWARDSWTPLKLLTYPLDYVGYMVQEHPVQSLVAGLAIWEVTDSGVSDAWDKARGKSNSKPKPPQPESRDDRDQFNANVGDSSFSGSFQSTDNVSLSVGPDGVSFISVKPPPPE